MTRLKMWTGVCVAFVLVSTVVSGMAVPQDPKVQDPKVQDKIFEGTNHVPAERIRAVFTNDDLTFTKKELDHIQSCGTCFKQCAEILTSVKLDQPE